MWLQFNSRKPRPTATTTTSNTTTSTDEKTIVANQPALPSDKEPLTEKKKDHHCHQQPQLQAQPIESDKSKKLSHDRRKAKSPVNPRVNQTATEAAAIATGKSLAAIPSSSGISTASVAIATNLQTTVKKRQHKRSSN